MKRFLSILILCWLAGCLPSFSNPHPPDNISPLPSSDFVYILPSKDVYETGEDLWFKAWQFNRSTLGLSGASQTLYLRLYAPTDSLVWDEKYPLADGRCSGHVYVDENWPEGEYRMEGYTKTSFHADSVEALHPRKVLIVNRIAAIDSLTRTLSAADSIRGASLRRFDILPEGGYLIYGVPCKAAFKYTDGAGMPIDAGGMLVEDGSREVCRLKSMHDGMGSISFTPLEGREYEAVLADGSRHPVKDIKASGVTMSLTGQNARFIRFVIRQSPDHPYGTLTLRATLRGIPCCSAKVTLSDSATVNLSTEYFPYQGIAEVTLLDKDGRPLAERLAYVNPQRKLNIEVTMGDEPLYRQTKGECKVRVTDEHGKPVQAELCVSLFDKWYSNSRVSETMLSHCLLSEDIRGGIHNPAYYFDDDNADRLQALDLLLMTQGWRRYKWHEYESNDLQEILTDGIPCRSWLNGKSEKRKKGKKKDEKMEQAVKLNSHDGSAEMIWTDSIGNFEITAEMMDRFRGGYIYLKALMKGEGVKQSVEIYDPADRISDVRKGKNSFGTLFKDVPRTIEAEDFTEISTGLGTYMLKGVTVLANKKKVFTDKMMGRLDSLAQISGSEWVCYHGRKFDKDGYPAKTECMYLNDHEDGWTHHPVGIKAEKETIFKPRKGYHYHMIKYLKYPPDPTKYYVAGQRDIVYTGSRYTEEQLLKMNNMKRIKGYYGEREFWQPDEEDLSLNMVDARNTLQWMPSVITDEKGEATIPFITSDDTGAFIGIIEGTEGFGLLGSKQFEFNVRKP